MINEYFYSNKYDEKIVLENSGQKISLGRLKELISEKIKEFGDEKNILITEADDFVVKFFAAVLSGKEIFLSTRKDCRIEKEIQKNKPEKVNPDEIFINFFTSGSTSAPKIIKKNLTNLLNEQRDLYEKFKDKIDENTKFVSTSTMAHMFGTTFQFMLPFFSGHIIDCDRISYPEELDEKENYVLVSTPSFLERINDYKFKNPPKLVITAGAKLNEKIFDKYSDIIEIYGSTETGVMAYRTSPCNFKKFDNVNIEKCENGIKVKSDYFIENEMFLNDSIEIINENEFTLKQRTDRLVKINEKRVSLCEVEKILKTHPFVEDCIGLKYCEKLCAAVVLNNDGKDFLIKNGRYETIKTLKKFMAENSEFIPKKWRFLYEIPKNICGKIDYEKLNYLFDLKLTLPVVLDKRQNEVDIVFLKHSNFFSGHFDGFPILPGVVQLFFAQYFIENMFNVKLSKEQIKKIKFTNPILPDKKLTLKIEKSGENFNYSYGDSNGSYSSGVFKLLAVFILLFNTAFASTLEDLPELKSVSCTFKQQKILPSRTLVSGGNFQFIKEKGVIFDTTYPIKMKSTFADNKQINDIILAIAQKNYTYVEKNFNITKTDHLNLTPKTKTLKEHINSISIYVDKYIKRIVINTVNNGKTDITFTNCREL